MEINKKGRTDMKWTIEKAHNGMNIRDYLQQVRGLSRRILISAKSEGGEILLNGSQETVRKLLHAGDKLEVKLPPEEVSKWLVPESINLSIIYEDETLIVLNKPAGMATLPSPKHKSGTLANALIAYYKQIGNPNTVHVVTRLDRETSGLILIAKDRLTHSLLAKSQKQFAIHRKYQAIIEGSLEKWSGTISEPIGRKWDSIVEREVTEAGKKAITHYCVISSWKEYSLVEIALETGRTHQIRVHFSHINHPLAGDDLYGGKIEIINRQALHCHELTFQHPYTNELLAFRTELPEDMTRIIKKLKGSF